jgi:hypothetical protein
LKNILDAKYVYFQEINYENMGVPQKDIWPLKKTIDETIIENAKERSVHLDRPYSFYKYISGGASTFFAYLFYLSL